MRIALRTLAPSRYGHVTAVTRHTLVTQDNPALAIAPAALRDHLKRDSLKRVPKYGCWPADQLGRDAGCDGIVIYGRPRIGSRVDPPAVR